MAYLSYRIWDGKSSLIGTGTTPDVLLREYNNELVTQRKQLVLYASPDEHGNPVENIAVFYDCTVSADTIKADFDAQVARQKAAEIAAAEEAKKPTLEQRLAAAEAAILMLAKGSAT